MQHTTFRVDIDCDNCGFSTAKREDNCDLRCTSCGRFASGESDACCVKHEVRDSPYPSGQCPYCERERNEQAMRRHQVTRDPTLEPY